MAKHEDLGAISPQEVTRALARSGYPLEIELFRQLHELQLRPELGRRMIVGDESAEVDVLAQVDGKFANLVMVIEAKNMTRTALVGFEWRKGRPDGEFMRREGFVFGGAPGWGDDESAISRASSTAAQSSIRSIESTKGPHTASNGPRSDATRAKSRWQITMLASG